MSSEAALLTASDHDEDVENEESPEDRACCLSKLLLAWLIVPIFRGSRKTLTEDDVIPIRSKWRSEYLTKRWNEEWKRSVHDFEKRNGNRNARAAQIPNENNNHPSIIYPLVRMFRWKIFPTTAMRFISDLMLFANPLMLKLLIDFVSDDKAPIGHGVALALGMFAIAELRSLLYNHSYTMMITTSVQVQSVLTNAVYAKALRLSTTAHNSKTVGATVNLMSIDIEKIYQVMPVTHHFWSTPLQLMLGMGLLYWTIGSAAIAGIAVMFLMVPVNYFSSTFRRDWQIKQMKVKDERTKISNEVFNGIKLIKLYAWEEAFEEKINELRKQEVQYLRRFGLLGRIVDTLNAAAPFVVAVASFSIYVLSDDTHVLTPQIAFVCLAIFNMIRTPMNVINVLINMAVQATVSNNRLKEFMSAEEHVGIDYDTPQEGNSLEMNDVSCGWKTGQTDLSNLSISLRTGSLTGIVGAVGTGKSSLLSATIGEMELQKGTIALSGRIAYVPQQAWLLNGSVRNNVLFGRDFNEHLYNQVTTACQLFDDFSILPYGDATLVGENGVTLSGGQKARVGLARALYQESDIYLLNDPLSAVDAHVGEAIYEQVLGKEGLLKNRTRILVTHGLQYTKEADNILVMKDGAIIQQGRYEVLEMSPGVFSDLLAEKTKVDSHHSIFESSDESSEDEDAMDDREHSKKRSNMAKLPSVPDQNLERNEVGKVKLDVWCSLIRAATIKRVFMFFSCYMAHFGFQIARNLWLSNWSDASSNTTVTDQQDVLMRLEVYTGIGLLEVFAVSGAFLFLVLATQKASLNLHGPTLRAILLSPMQFFDTTPIGRILNRLSRELDVIDSLIPSNVQQLFTNLLQLVAILVVISYSTPLFIAAILPLAVIYIFVLNMYVPTARQLRRLESTARSPILSIFAESIHGVTTIRACDKIVSSCTSFSIHVDKFAKTRYFLLVVNSWLNVYLGLFGNFVVLFAALFAVISSRYFSASPGLIGLSVSYALTITEMLSMTIRMLSEIETSAVSVERVQEYTKLEAEALWQSSLPPPEDWPVNPSIDCKQLSLRYRADLPLVLHGVDARIHAREKVAIVGRTGSGKSSLTISLFRMIEAAEGSITLDGIDTSLIGLHELRKKLAIIPQEPVLFSGSLRFNLDPFSEYTDDQLWKTLDLCQLQEFVSSSPGQLAFPIAEGGKNISVGQKQLICLARVLLRRAKVLVLDEATASVDVLTDSLVQSVVREEFREATVIAIAHRLNTVAGYDRIMVLEKGRIVEFDTPSRLLSDRNSYYSRLLEKSKRAENRRK